MKLDKRRHCISLFLSSPGDLRSERGIVDEVTQQISRDIGTIDNFTIELVRWETHAHAARGQYPQDVINAQIGDEYDIFLGMLGTRFGTPTKAFGSGTEEEFQRALQRNKASGLPEILFLFSSIAMPVDSIDASQLALVQEFKKSLPSQGLLYGTFDSEISLRTKLYSDLLHAVRRVLRSRSDADREKSSAEVFNPIFDPLLEWHLMLHSDSEVNATVLMQNAVSVMGIVASDMIQMATASKKLTTSLNKETGSIAKFVLSNNHSRIEASIMRASEAIKAASRQFFEIAPRLNKNFTEGSTLSQRSIEIFRTRGELSQSMNDSVRLPLTSMSTSMDSLADSLECLVQKLKEEIWPNTPFSIEQRKLRAILSDIIRIVRQGNVDLKRLDTVLANEAIQ